MPTQQCTLSTRLKSNIISKAQLWQFRVHQWSPERKRESLRGIVTPDECAA